MLAKRRPGFGPQLTDLDLRSAVAYGAFKDSMLFPFALTIIGLAIIYAGIQYQRNRRLIEERIHGLIPARVRQFLPQARA